MILIFLLCFSFVDWIKAQMDFTKYGDTVNYSTFMNNMTELYKELFTTRNSNKALSPVFLSGGRKNATSNPLFIHFTLFYMKMFFLDAESQQLSLCIELVQTWRDARLAWDPDEYDGIEGMYVNVGEIWIPDNMIGNTKSLNLAHADAIRAAKIESDGTITMPTVYYVEISCVISVDVFPFDKQACELPVMSFAYLPADVITNGSVSPEALSLYAGNGEWNVTHVTTKPISFVTMQLFYFIIHVKRVPNFYVYVIALPCFILTLLSIIGMFWSSNIKKEQLTKLSIGLTSLVSMTVLLDLLSTSIPKTEVFPLLGICVVVCVGIISAACVIIVVFSLQNPRKKTEAEMKRAEEEEKRLTKGEKIRHFFTSDCTRRHIFFQLCFQGVNLAGFIVFLSFWD